MLKLKYSTTSKYNNLMIINREFPGLFLFDNQNLIDQQKHKITEPYCNKTINCFFGFITNKKNTKTIYLFFCVTLGHSFQQEYKRRLSNDTKSRFIDLELIKKNF